MKKISIDNGTDFYEIDDILAMAKAIRKGIPLDKIRAEIHATAEMHEDGDYYLRDEWIDEIIDKYAKQEPKTGWIPVSERLPEDGQSVLFCDSYNDIMIGYHVKGRPDTHFSQNGTYEDIKNVRA